MLGEAERLSNSVDICVSVSAGVLPFGKLLLHGIAHEQPFGVLWQKSLTLSKHVDACTAIELLNAGDHAEQGRLPTTVSADERMDGPLRNAQVETAEHPIGRSFVSSIGVGDGYACRRIGIARWARLRDKGLRVEFA